MSQRLLRRKETLARTGLSNSSMYERIAKSTFPAPVKIGPRAVGWVESEIDDWIAERIRESRQAA